MFSVVTLRRRSRVRASKQPAPAEAAAPPERESYYVHAPPNRAKGRPMGWYSVDGDLSEERYWDGSRWTAQRRMMEGGWSRVPFTT